MLSHDEPSLHVASGAAALPDDRPVILIVDDTPDNLALLSDTLRAAGYAVLVALDGASAIERLSLITPDAVLLDAMMPGMDGFETCRQIKLDPRNRHLPVIFMTALAESEHVVQGFRVGGVDYVTKPVRPSEVVARIAAHVQRSQAQRQADLVLEMGMKAALIVRGTGEIVWQSDLARQRVAGLWGIVSPDALPADTRLPPTLVDWLRRWIDNDVETSSSFECSREGIRRVTRVLGRAARGDWVIVIDEYDDVAQTIDLSQRFGLTAREAEVLLWLSRGKTNRDIGEIVGMASRTVNKHLEHIFAKLNVETRAAATAIAIQIASR